VPVRTLLFWQEEIHHFVFLQQTARFLVLAAALGC
jgi:hypothetical protein